MKTLYKNVKATVEVTGQEVPGYLLYEEIKLCEGLFVETKYNLIFRSNERIRKFAGISKITLNNGYEFIGYCGVHTLIARDVISELPERNRIMKAMLSQPMAGKTDEEIVATREKAIKVLKEKGYEIVNTLFTDEWYSNEAMKERGVVQIPLCFLAKSLENMSLCHAVYFCKGWENARGCRIEHDAAVAYGLDIIYEE
nr:DUF4406 domain-containing protein [uncultured Dorea sp.]